jgi:hypothetical protein
MHNIRLISVLSVLVIISSCSKETSIENGGNTSGGGALGTNCRVNTIIAADALSGTGLYSLFTNFNGAMQATRIEAYDSIRAAMDASENLVYKGDTIIVNASEYFVTDANKRVSKFYTRLDPADPSSEQIIYGYTYNTAGYLVSKSVSIQSIPLPFILITYTWAGGNLVKIDGLTTVPGSPQKVLTANLEYDGTKTAKNFIQVMPDGFEISFYIMALDLGKKSINVIKKVNMTIYDEQGAPAVTYNTTITDLKFSTDGYLTEWFAGGDSIDGLGIFDGRTIFKYICN